MQTGYGGKSRFSRFVSALVGPRPLTVLDLNSNGFVQEWLELKGKDNRKNAPWTVAHEEEVTHAYFHYYSAHFDQPHLREAWAQIPHLLQIDDHDM